MVEPLPQAENKNRMNFVMNYNKALSVPTCKTGTLIIGYLNAVSIIRHRAWSALLVISQLRKLRLLVVVV